MANADDPSAQAGAASRNEGEPQSDDGPATVPPDRFVAPGVPFGPNPIGHPDAVSDVAQATDASQPAGGLPAQPIQAAAPATISNSSAMLSRTPEYAAPPARQIAAALRRNPGADTIIVRLHPRELGDLELRIAVHPGGVHLQVTAERRETYDSFVASRPELEQQLAEAGVTLGSGGLDLRHGGGEAPPWQAAGPRGMARPNRISPSRSAAARRGVARGLLDIFV